MNLPSEKSVNISEKDVIFAMGIRFWSNLVLTDDISSVQKCVEILDNLKMISENKEAFNLIFRSEGVEEKNDKNQTVNMNHETQHQPTRPFLIIKQMPVQDEYHLKFDDTNKDIPCTQKSTESAVLDDILTDPFPEDKTDETKEAKKDERYKCAFCKFQHNHLKNLRQHMRNIHEEHYSSFLSQNNLIYSVTCEYCKDQFKSMVKLKCHVSNEHENNFSEFEEKHKIYRCKICVEKFFTKKASHYHEMKEHQEKEQSYERICDECGETFSAKHAYIYHVKKTHREVNFVCEICSYSTVSKTVLQQHRLTHLSPNLPCKFCDKLFHTSFNLKRHINTMHTDAKTRPFQCQECEKGFYFKHLFRDHMNVHTGIKPYKCDFCETQFQNASNRIAHVKKIHPQSCTTK